MSRCCDDPSPDPPGWAGADGPPVLTDGVVRLRPLRHGDVPAIRRSVTDPDLIEWTTIPLPYAEADALDFVERHGRDGWRSGRNPTWALADPVDDGYCGGVDLRLDGAGGAEVGYAVAPWARRRGYAWRALTLVCGWAFDVAGLEVIGWTAYAGNEPSRRVARRVGFTVLDGVLRLGSVQRGRRRDAWVGDLLPGDLRRP